MNNEIKEILDDIPYIPNAVYRDLLDYITNLQQENEIRQQDINNLTYQLAKMKAENERLKEENTKLYKKDTKIINDLKLNQTKEVFDTIAELIKNGETCSYRYLIYDLLGFQQKDYVDLMGGLAITNMLVDCQDYKSRCEKAIEYIEKLQENDDIEIWREDGYWAYILDILQNGSKDE